MFRIYLSARPLRSQVIGRVTFSTCACIGYLNASSTKIGYISQTSKHAVAQNEPVSLHRILSEVESAADIPELGTCFDLAKAIATTVFEFHNIGWLHKNIRPRNVLFWPCRDHNGILDLRIPC